MQIFRNIKKCRVCYSKNLVEVIKIKEQFLSPTFVKENVDIISKLKVPHTLVLCSDCSLLQLKETVNPDLLYKNYFYRSATSDTMRRDLKKVVVDINRKVDLFKGDNIVDIGANDCTMLSYFNEDLNRIGIEPAENIDWSKVDDNIKIVNDYFNENSLKKCNLKDKVKVFSSCAMFYDLDNPNSFMKVIKNNMDKNGIFCVQLSYLPSMLKNLNFYDICNEHLEYYSLHSLSFLMESHNLKIFEAAENDVNGGSIRVFISHKERKIKESNNLKNLYKAELQMSLKNKTTYTNFYNKILNIKSKVRKAIFDELKNGLVFGLGASTKGNMLLQTFDLGKDIIPFISERNSSKVGLKTLGTDIELISEISARKKNPKMMLVLPWYFKDEIIKRERSYLLNGGKLLIPMPYPHIVNMNGEIKL